MAKNAWSIEKCGVNILSRYAIVAEVWPPTRLYAPIWFVPYLLPKLALQGEIPGVTKSSW